MAAWKPTESPKSRPVLVHTLHLGRGQHAGLLTTGHPQPCHGRGGHARCTCCCCSHPLLSPPANTHSASNPESPPGINGLSRQVEAADRSPALGPCRLTSGVCGDPIRHEGLRFVEQARQVRGRLGHGVLKQLDAWYLEKGGLRLRVEAEGCEAGGWVIAWMHWYALTANR